MILLYIRFGSLKASVKSNKATRVTVKSVHFDVLNFPKSFKLSK